MQVYYCHYYHQKLPLNVINNLFMPANWLYITLVVTGSTRNAAAAATIREGFWQVRCLVCLR